MDSATETALVLATGGIIVGLAWALRRAERAVRRVALGWLWMLTLFALLVPLLLLVSEIVLTRTRLQTIP